VLLKITPHLECIPGIFLPQRVHRQNAQYDIDIAIKT